MPNILFDPGRLMITPGASWALSEEYKAIKELPSSIITPFVNKHLTGDWGEMDSEDQETNAINAKFGGRILSEYTLPKTCKKLWIITEADRSVTTILLPEEY